MQIIQKATTIYGIRRKDCMICCLPAIELVCLMQPTEHARNSYQQAILKCQCKVNSA